MGPRNKVSGGRERSLESLREGKIVQPHFLHFLALVLVLHFLAQVVLVSLEVYSLACLESIPNISVVSCYSSCVRYK